MRSWRNRDYQLIDNRVAVMRTGHVRNFGNALLVVCGCLVAFLLAEAGMRLFSPIEFRVRSDRIALPANVTYAFRLQHYGLDEHVTVAKNELGFRGPPPTKADGDIKIVTMGGSTTECLYLTDGKTWTDLLGQRLSDTFANVWTNNAGLDGHSSYGHLVLLRDHLLKLKPDYLVILLGVNDVGADAPNKFDRDGMASGLDLSSPKEFLRSAARYSDVLALALNAYRVYRARQAGIVRDVGHWGSGPEPQLPRNRIAGNNEIWADDYQRLTGRHLVAYEERLSALVSLAREGGIEPVLMTQPAVFGPARDSWTGWNLATIYGLWSVNGATAWAVLEDYNDVTRAVARKHNILLIDLAGKMEKSVRFFYDTIHYTNAGAVKIAEIAFPSLCRLLIGRHPDRKLADCEA